MAVGDTRHGSEGTATTLDLVDVTLSLDPALLELVDAYAQREGISHSEAVEDALLAWFGRDSTTWVPALRREHDCY